MTKVYNQYPNVHYDRFFLPVLLWVINEFGNSYGRPNNIEPCKLSTIEMRLLTFAITLNESGSQCQYRAFILHAQDHCMLIYFSARHKNQSSSKSSAHSPPPPPVQPPKPPSPIRAVKLEFQDQEIHKLEKFGKLLAGPNTDLGKNIIFLRTVTIILSVVDLGFYIFRGHKEIELVRYSSHCTPNNLAATMCKFVELLLALMLYIVWFLQQSNPPKLFQ